MPWDIWLIFLVLGVVLPWRGRARMRKLLAMPHVSSMERLSLYASTIAFQWFSVSIVAWRAWVHGFSALQLGLTVPDRSRILVAAVVGASATASLQWLNLRRMGRIPVEARGSLQAIAERILPQSGVELLPYLALAITAGLCEEFLYRGFAMAVLDHVGLRAWAGILLSSVLFGLAHSYQGRGGIVMTFLIGLILGTSRLADVGSGGGFPGLTLKIIRPRLQVFLVESNIKKVTFLAEVIRELGLTGAHVLARRYEELGEEIVPLDYVCSRALGEFPGFLEWAKSEQIAAKQVVLWIGARDLPEIQKISTWDWQEPILVPNSLRRLLLVRKKKGLLIGSCST